MKIIIYISLAVIVGGSLLLISDNFNRLEFEKNNSNLKKDTLYSLLYDYSVKNLSTRFSSLSLKEKKCIQKDVLFIKETLKKNDMPLDIFCEYVLPQTISNEKIVFWRDDCLLEFKSLIKEDNIHNICDSINKYWSKKFVYSNKRKSSILPNWFGYKENPEGDCIDMARMVLYPLRALGYATTIDYVVAWGNTNGSHYWNSLYIDGKMQPFMGVEHGINYDPFSIYTHLKDSTKDGLRYPGKVLRYTFSINEHYLKLMQKAGEGKSFKLFSNLYFKDVTSEYFKVQDIHLSVPQTKEQVLYLAVFNKNKWTPIAASFVEGQSISFPDMKEDMLYLLVNAKKKAIKPPFILKKDSIVFLKKTDSYTNIEMEYLQSRIMEYQYGWGHVESIPNDYFKGIAEDYYRKKPQKNHLYKLCAFINNNWKIIAQSTATKEGKIVFHKIPQNMLYLIKDTNDNIISRCFTYCNSTIYFW